MIDVTVKFTKIAMRSPDLMQALNNVMAIAVPTAQTIRDRVTKRHELVTPPLAYKNAATAGGTRSTSKTGGKAHRAAIASLKAEAFAQHVSGQVSRARSAGLKAKPMYYISPAYAAQCGLGTATRFESSADMHAAVGAKSGEGNVTGAMWGGLQVRNSGRSAIIEFGGSSLGASSVRSARTVVAHGPLAANAKGKQVRILSRDEGGQVQYRRKPKLVRNAEKAGRVFRNSAVGLLMVTAAETRAQYEAFRDQAAELFCKCFGSRAQRPLPVTGDRALYEQIRRNFNV